MGQVWEGLSVVGSASEAVMWFVLGVHLFFVFVFCGQSWSNIRRRILKVMIENPAARKLAQQRIAYPMLCVGVSFTLYYLLRWLLAIADIGLHHESIDRWELQLMCQRRALLGVANVTTGPLLYSLHEIVGGKADPLFQLERKRMETKIAQFKPSAPMATFLDVHMHILDWIVSPQLYKLENIPDKPVLFVGNHTIVGVDMPLLIAHMYKKKGIFLRGLADTLHFDLPVWGQLLTAAGAVVGTRPTCRALMEAGENILVYPGGANEVFKKVGADKYELQWKNRVGFAKMAIDHGYTIVPVASVGTNEMLDVVYDIPMGWLFRGKRGDISAPVLKPPGLRKLQRVYFSFGEAIETAQYDGDSSQQNSEIVRNITKRALEKEIEWLRSVSENDPERVSVERVVNAVKSTVANLMGKKGDKTE